MIITLVKIILLKPKNILNDREKRKKLSRVRYLRLPKNNIVCIFLYVSVSFEAFDGHIIIHMITEVRYRVRKQGRGRISQRREDSIYSYRVLGGSNIDFSVSPFHSHF